MSEKQVVAQQAEGPYHLMVGDWKDKHVALHGPEGHIVSGLTRQQGRDLVEHLNTMSLLTAAPSAAQSAGYKLAMRVLQSDLYRLLDDAERAECDEFIARGMKAPSAAPVDAQEFGCHCDLEPHMTPDGCVIDEGKPQDCVYARRHERKEQCQYWQPIAAPGAPTEAQESSAAQPDPDAMAETINNQALRIGRLESVLRAIFNELDEDDDQSPGHFHRVLGRWDESGEPCEWCATWNAARALLAAVPPLQISPSSNTGAVTAHGGSIGAGLFKRDASGVWQQQPRGTMGEAGVVTLYHAEGWPGNAVSDKQ